MSPSYYRFRSTDKLLGTHQELEKQEIYFAPPKDLNDPMDGFKDLCWIGDQILWSNLLSHYLLTLINAIIVCRRNPPDWPATDATTFVHCSTDRLPTPNQNLLRAAQARFFREKQIDPLIELLISRKTPVRRDELTCYLVDLHSRALDAVLSAFEEISGVFRPDSDPLRKAAERPLESIAIAGRIKRAELENPNQPELVEAIVSAEAGAAMRRDLELAYLRGSRGPDTFWAHILFGYPQQYVTDLEQLLYVEWYTACFVRDPANPSMWGVYGDGHKGICLKMKSHPNAKGTPCLRLEGINGYRSLAGGGTEILKHMNLYELREVKYAHRFVTIDFFGSMGGITSGAVRSWGTGENGAISSRVADLLDGSAEWRQSYWERFISAITTKTKAWAHEAECRITLQSMLNSYAERDRRKLLYDFNDLEGVIFGENTPREPKLEVMRIVANKCRLSGRKKFEFYQASYSSATGRMENAPMQFENFP